MENHFEKVRTEIKKHLIEFLLENNIEYTKNSSGHIDKFKCINPEHDDTHPSMSVKQMDNGVQLYYCFSCGAGGDIFTANNLLFNKPLIGYEFVMENMKQLADKYNIEFEPRPMTDEEIELMNYRSILLAVKDIITVNMVNGKISEPVKDYMMRKKLTNRSYVNFYGIGCVDNWDHFISDLYSRGATKAILEKMNIERYIFNENSLIFTISDEFANPIGFAARNCVFDKEDKTDSKYFNSRISAVYNKSEILYNLHRAAKKSSPLSNSLYIVEGYTDAIALDNAGYKAAAICGTSFTEKHISLLQRVGITDIALLLDGDSAGKKSATKIVEHMENIRNFRVRIVILPDDMDPDEYIMINGNKSILKLEHVSPFEWKLRELRAKNDLNGYDLAKQVIPLIVNERSAIERDKMCKELANISDVPVETIRRELYIISNDKEIKIKEEKEAILDNTVKLLKKNPEDALIILSDAQKNIRLLAERRESNIYDEVECVDALKYLQFHQEQEDANKSIYLWRMNKLERVMDGNIEKNLILLNGQPNAGKSSLIINLIGNMLRAGQADDKYGILANENKYNDITILFHSVDDPREDVISRLITMLSYEYFANTSIKYIEAPHKYKYGDYDKFVSARRKAYEMVEQWMKQGRLIIKDASHGANLSSANIMIDVLRNKFHNRKFLYICDNMFDLTDYAHLDETPRTKILCTSLKNIATTEDILVLSTVEYRKGNEGKYSSFALNESMRGSKGMEYDADLIIHLINELKNNPNTDMYFNEDGDDKKYPIITMKIGKNKITEHEEDIHYYFIPKRTVYNELHSSNLYLLNDTVLNKLRWFYEPRFSKDPF